MTGNGTSAAADGDNLSAIADPRSPTGWRQAAWEIGLIFLIFFLFAGGPPPDVNEAHYLAKARHYWDKSWCANDLFLESGDAHITFYWSFGWLSLFLSLTALAWTGRILTWALLAWSWRRLSVAVVPLHLFAPLSAGLFLCLHKYGHVAGEWVVGGVEAKGFAFVFLFLGLEAMVRNRWQRVWLLLGAASAFHVLVGGWSVVAAACVWLTAGSSRPPAIKMLPALAAGLVLALPGLVPAIALSAGADSSVIGQANQIYVFQRLSHHLVLSRFTPLVWRFPGFTIIMPSPFILRHLGLAVVWAGLAYATRRDRSLRTLQTFVGGAVLIALAGVGIDLCTRGNPAWAAALLRFYWFRLSDVAVPMGTAFAALGAIAMYRGRRPVLSNWCLCAAIILATANVAHTALLRQSDFRPGAEQQMRPAGSLSPQLLQEIGLEWRNACHWINQNSTPQDVFLTPRNQQTFKWYAGRAEVASWKDVPQDAASLVEWWRRQREIYPPVVAVNGLAAVDDERLVELCHRYGAKYIVLDRTRSMRPLRLPRVYPNATAPNRFFEVYRVPLRPE